MIIASWPRFGPSLSSARGIAVEKSGESNPSLWPREAHVLGDHEDVGYQRQVHPSAQVAPTMPGYATK